MAQRPGIWCAAFGGALFLAAAAAAAGQTCPPPPKEPPFTEPPVIERKCNGQPCRPGQYGGIDTEFRIETRTICVPQSTNPPTAAPLTLRTYVYPDPKNPGNWIYGVPGPTLELRKPSTQGGKGDHLNILLVNNLQAGGDPKVCDSACPATDSQGNPFKCPDRSQLPDPFLCPGSGNQDCCCWVNANQLSPNCFHGDNTTNMHFHGTHVSPQSPQDYVLLELHPAGEKGKQIQAMTARSDLEFGSFHYKVNPLTYEQAEGTHWYHPHKHGSVSLQVANGMPGAIIIRGPFDDWLDKWYRDRGVKLTEKIMVAEQVQQGTNLYAKSGPAPVLINGLLNPKLTVPVGEVQRWRIVSATQQASNQAIITFPASLEVVQIEQDGVQFAPRTYGSQPLLKNGNILLSPGNRGDFLVRAKTVGKVHVSAEIAGNLSEHGRELVEQRANAVRAAAGLLANEPPALFTVEVVEAPKGKAGAVPPGFPTEAEWPQLPWYLKDVQPSEIVGHPNLTFGMVAVTNGLGPGGPTDPANKFVINDRQYCPDCVNVTSELDTADEWHVENSTLLAHPFHIHTNPFQLVEEGLVINGQSVPSVKYDPPIWMDTIALPTQGRLQNFDAGPIYNNEDARRKCPPVCQQVQRIWSGNWNTTIPGQMSVCQCGYNGYVKLLQRYLDFTGEYVLHCHFLGHEDRGMMFGVQTVCKDKPDSFGKAKLTGPECVAGNYVPATQKCPADSKDCPMSH